MAARFFSTKSQTRFKQVVPLAAPPVLSVPLPRYFGGNPCPLVSIGQKVMKYQLIACDTGRYSVSVHAPVSGEVTGIRESLLADGTTALLVDIKNDFQETEARLPILNPETCSADILLQRISEAGIAGAGGAQFPTAVKYQCGGKEIDTLIINGAECEPYLNADYAVMSQQPEKLMVGISLINRILAAREVVIAIESHNREVGQRLVSFAGQAGLVCRMALLPDAYPQGSELQLIYAVTGKELPRNVRAAEAGIVVSNVGTVRAVYDAIVHSRPFVSRVVTVAGEGVGQAGNFEIRIGTPVRHVLKALAILHKGKKLVFGGPMMGRQVMDFSMPITKGTGGLIVLPDVAVRRSPCISCGYCADVCPMRLMPMKYDELRQKERYSVMAEKYSLFACIECGACEYICPSRVPLMESIRIGKEKSRAH